MSENYNREQEKCEQYRPTSTLQEKAAHFAKKLSTNPMEASFRDETSDCCQDDSYQKRGIGFAVEASYRDEKSDCDHDDCCDDDCKHDCCDDDCKDDCCDDCKHDDCCDDCKHDDCCPKRGISFTNVLLSIKDINR